MPYPTSDHHNTLESIYVYSMAMIAFDYTILTGTRTVTLHPNPNPNPTPGIFTTLTDTGAVNFSEGLLRGLRPLLLHLPASKLPGR